MKATRKVVCWLAASLAAPVLAVAGGSEADSARSAADTKDSPVTAAVKTKLAAEHVGNIANIKVDADQEWLDPDTGNSRPRGGDGALRRRRAGGEEHHCGDAGIQVVRAVLA